MGQAWIFEDALWRWFGDSCLVGRLPACTLALHVERGRAIMTHRVRGLEQSHLSPCRSSTLHYAQVELRLRLHLLYAAEACSFHEPESLEWRWPPMLQGELGGSHSK